MKTILSADEVKKFTAKQIQSEPSTVSRSSLSKGKSLALIGESGSGKTTFGKLAVGLEKVSSGTISFMGKEIQNLKEKEIRRLRRDMQMIFQSSSGVFEPGYTIGESIYEVLKNYVSLSKAEYSEAIEEVLEKSVWIRPLETAMPARSAVDNVREPILRGHSCSIRKW